MDVRTRPYTRAEVACGWAGAVKWQKKAKRYRPTDRQTIRQMDRVGCRVACTRLKTPIFTMENGGVARK